MYMTTISSSLSSSAFFTPALFALQKSSDQLSASTIRLASGNRLVRASDDVASFSIAARMQSQLSGLKQASQNIAQGGSLLQVAEGGLGQVLELLDLMNATAVQANSASLSSTDRTFLQQQFAAYQDEINRIASNTSFNAISLLDGALSGASKALTQTTQATRASATLTFSANPTAGQTVVLNGVSLVANTDFTVGGSTQDTIDSLVTALSNSTNAALSGAVYERVGANGLRITAKSGGAIGNQYTIGQATSTASFTTVGGGTNVANIYTLTGGSDNGLGYASTIATGNVGNSLLTTQSQVRASVTLTITGSISDGELLRIDNGNGGFIDFTFRTSAGTSTEIQIGSTTEETLQNAVAKLTQYSGSDNYGLRQLEFAINGNQLVMTNRIAGNATDLSGAALDIAETLANGALSASSFNNGANTGVSVTGVNNGDFVGTIQGFSATYVSADNITLSLTVGSNTYTATLADTTPGADTTLRFSSANGGFFDVRIASGGQAVTNQAGADSFAASLNAAFATLSFYNNRPISNFVAAGSFLGASAKVQLSNFNDVRIDSLRVLAPTTSDGTIDIVVNGETFRASSGLGGKIGAYETVKFTSLNDSNRLITLTNGSVAKDFSSAEVAATFQTALRTAFGLGTNGSGVDFQVGTDSDDTINVVVADVRADTLFNGASPSVATTDAAAAAQTSIATAKSAVLDAMSVVGATQRRFDAARSVIESTMEGLTAARSNLTDTDIVAESTAYAQAAVKINAAVAVIAQARNLQSSLVGALQFSTR
jgi:flagellin